MGRGVQHACFVAIFMPDKGIPMPSEPPEYPMYAQQSLDAVVQGILIPVMTHKKHNSLQGGTSALTINFVKEALPGIEQMYQLESAARVSAQVGETLAAEDAMASVEDTKQINIPPDEGRQLEKEYEKIKKELIDEMAQDPPPMPTKPLPKLLWFMGASDH